MTVYVVGPMCLLALYALLAQKRYYHYVQICLCVCEIYGGWITFGMCYIVNNHQLTHARIHAHTRTYMHTRAHTHTRTHTPSHAHTHTHTNACVCVQLRKCAHLQIRPHNQFNRIRNDSAASLNSHQKIH